MAGGGGPSAPPHPTPHPGPQPLSSLLLPWLSCFPSPFRDVTLHLALEGMANQGALFLSQALGPGLQGAGGMEPVCSPPDVSAQLNKFSRITLSSGEVQGETQVENLRVGWGSWPGLPLAKGGSVVP